ncbi:hypothetical protein J2Y48_002491 [Mycoplana sp. BE70]|uniref:DUF2971 domain-containing protein n=1 Tax=Mycoplana sp. BE70 TaxID=2817775 RepID=UPI00285F21C4|nr:DUF2971 domain-containing protein [Mycoplana sp. BE70]MDR6757195.1 hypothetical protein [Mycoplana sp. BE70]
MDDNNDLFAAISSTSNAKHFPKTLSHYTSLDGFLGIIRESRIRASNILFLNDKEEMQYGINVARDVINELVEQEPSAAALKPTGRSPRPNVIPDTYACCFCEEADMLSQWRGYGSASQSVSIQFDGPLLAKVARALQFDLEAVIYGKKRAMELLRETLNDEVTTATIIRSLLKDDGYNVDDYRRSVTLDLSPRFKNDAFAEEREWRIIAKAHVVKQVEYRTRDNVIMPYVNISNPTVGLPITRVTIGPGKDTALTRKSVEKFLSQTQFYSHVKAVESSIPFRT